MRTLIDINPKISHLNIHHPIIINSFTFLESECVNLKVMLKIGQILKTF